MTKTVHGKIHGRTIELDEDVGLADGEDVVVIVKPQSPGDAGVKASNARRASLPTSHSSMKSLSRSPGTVRRQLFETRNRELPAGHQHLFCPHSSPRWIGASVYPVWRTTGDPDDCVGRTLCGCLHDAGAYMLPNPTKILTGINDLLDDVTVLPFDSERGAPGPLRGDSRRGGREP